MGITKEIEERFRRDFGPWGINLPPDEAGERRQGKIVAARWAICYLFGSDERGKYLDYYACHRMTGDQHVRIHAASFRTSARTLKLVMTQRRVSPTVSVWLTGDIRADSEAGKGPETAGVGSAGRLKRSHVSQLTPRRRSTRL